MGAMNLAPITRELVIARSRSLPSFPCVVVEIVNTLDDPDSNLDILVRAIRRDPLISARVISLANTAALRGTRTTEINDISAATSLIGLNRLRHIALISSLSTFVNGAARNGLPNAYWTHSVAVGICCEELAIHCGLDVAPSMALLAGLVHDIGQLWLYHFDPKLAHFCRGVARDRAVDIEQVEREHFGIGHGCVGAWLLEHWALPEAMAEAVSGHHDGKIVASNPLVALVQVAEVLSNALDLVARAENRVTNLSLTACEQLGLIWDDSARHLFGRIESRANHETAFFNAPAP